MGVGQTFVGGGTSKVSAPATTVAARLMPAASRKPDCAGTVSTSAPGPATVTVVAASTAATTAEEVEVPTARIRALSPLAAAVSDWGTAAMISAGIAA